VHISKSNNIKHSLAAPALLDWGSKFVKRQEIQTKIVSSYDDDFIGMAANRLD